MSLTFPSLDVLRARRTMKWTRYAPDVLPLWVAETDFDTCPAVAAAVADAVDREYFGYPESGPASRDLAEALASFTATRHGWTIDPATVTYCPDVVKGIMVAVEALTEEGSTIVIPMPAYPPFQKVPQATRRPVIYVPMADNGFDLDALERAFTSDATPHGVGSMILCNPFNPLGRAFTADELRAVVDLADRHHVRVISDEIHAPLVYSGRHIPTASVSETAAANTVTVTATSKGWNTAGLKCAQIIATNPEDAKIIGRLSNLLTGEASTIGLQAATAAYTGGYDWLVEEVDYLAANWAHLTERLPEVLPGIRLPQQEATFLAWLDVSDVDRLKDADGTVTRPAERLRERAKVAFNEGTDFGPVGAGRVRLNFGTSREILDAALDRIATADL
ncbi:MalY/PatB family protein [Corynebacterium terpenotabidum]|uniref:cysteine-S-conjugate beta-lyase n=1 Tax=Corynebacterium terpenotabidum Y-11 TaxID=1200352 RepID=S4XD83_9CORY|nr:aminotransferase class I/II-fold pyridoxal phosphate-dependent enzyme [Corynebacterium terpenotabidum]AGP30469.1 cystathionine beta-lyase [Corynebacterium terpenotabidum Y-11]